MSEFKIFIISMQITVCIVGATVFFKKYYQKDQPEETFIFRVNGIGEDIPRHPEDYEKITIRGAEGRAIIIMKDNGDFIINGKKAITADTALQFESVMPEIPARFWLNLETDYQLTKALVKRGKVRNHPRVRSLGVGASGRTETSPRTTEERAEPHP